MRLPHLFLAVILATALPSSGQAGPIRCSDDGDGGGACIWGRAEGVEAGAVQVRGLRIQLTGIVVPAPRDLCGGKDDFACAKPARKRMGELVAKGVACDILAAGGDSLYGRCRVADGDLGRLLVQSGYAKAAKDGPYETEQSTAIAAKKGLWAADITLPRDWESARKRQDKE